MLDQSIEKADIEPETKTELLPNQSKDDKPPKSYLPLPAPLVLQYLIILRIINAFTVNTFFQPDEYFQSLEPAHELAYGYGEVTWEWLRQLRSFNYPFIFFLSYKLGDLFGFGDVGVYLMPKITQGIISAISEYYLYVFAQKALRNELLARTVLFLSIVSSFNWFCFTRTFSNTLELNLTTIALSFWPWDFYYTGYIDSVSSLTKAFFFAALAVVVRPTNIFVWLPLGAHFLYKVPGSINKTQVILRVFSVGLTVLSINVAIDYFYYGEVVFPVLNFLKFNVLNSFADFYGVNAWHFHLTQSLPFILTTYLPTFGYGLFHSNYKLKSLFIAVIFVNLVVFSLITHKEFRFIYQLMPFFLIFAADGFLQLYNASANGPKKLLCKMAIYGTVLVNLGISVFLSQVQEKGVIDVINFLKFNPDVDTIGFLTPCHSTPLHLYLHREDLKDKIWSLSCDPPSPAYVDPEKYMPKAIKEYLENYKDVSDVFYEDPKMFLDVNFPPLNKRFRNRRRSYNYEWPTHLVFFESLEPFMKQYLQNSKYEECDRFFNSYFHWDARRQGDVVVYCKWPWE